MSNTIPTDSVLRRHHEASHGKTTQNKEALNDKTTQSESARLSSSNSFICWLKQLFGG